MTRRARILLTIALWSAALSAVGLVVWRQPDDATIDRDAPLFHAGRDLQPRRELPSLSPLPASHPVEYRGDRRNTGRSPYVGPTEAHERWSFQTEAPIVTQPVVAARDQTVYVTSLDGHLYALSRHGDLKWKQDLGGPIYATPLLDEEGNVYVGSDAGSFFSFTSEGQPRWRIVVEDDADTSPTRSPAGDRIYFAAGTDLWAVALDGSIAWRFRSRGKIFSSPAVDDDGTVYFGAQDDYFYAVSSDGNPRWEVRTAGDNDGSPSLSEETGYLYFGSDARSVYAFDRSGRQRWQAEVDGYVRAAVGLGLGGNVIAGTLGRGPRIVALDLRTGAEQWSMAVRSTQHERGVLSGPLVDREGNVYVGAFDGYVYAVTPSGALRWVFQIGSPVDGTPTLAADGLLYIGADDGRLYALADTAGR